MSAICGIVHFDGRPVDEARVRAMVEAAGDRSPDGKSCWVQGNVGLGFGAFHDLPESSRCRQPLADPGTGLCVGFAGRVDNRKELRGRLESAGYRLRDGSDAELALLAYSCWQEGGLDEILGDFALAIWDQRQRRLFCARDLVGTKPFYYYKSQNSFFFASEIRQLLALPEIPRRPNEGMLGEYLVSRMASKRETQFEGVLRLPPASCLVVENGRVEEREYWDPTAVPAVRYNRDGEYVEQLRELLWRAVRSRLRSDSPVGIQLSGGVDSSSVVAVAADLARNTGVPSPGLEAFSLVFPGWDCDESGFIDAVADKTVIVTHRLVPEPADQGRCGQQVARYLDYPDYPNGAMSDPLEQAAHDRGTRVLLTGLGGDEWFQRPDLHLADLLRQGRFFAATRWINSLPDARWLPIKQHAAYVDGISPLVPESVKKRLRRHRLAAQTPPWIGRDFASRSDLVDRLRQPLDWRPFGDLARAGSFRAATQGFQTHAMEMEERSAASYHLDLRYPFHDRRVIEFGMGLPAEQRWRDGLHKHVLREAMRDHLPEIVRQRSSKAEFSRVFVGSLLAIGRRAFLNLAIAEAGWVEGEILVEMFDRMERRCRSEQVSQGPELWPLWSAYGAELLYRGVFNKSCRGG